MSRQPSPTQITRDQRQLENTGYLKYWDGMITNDKRCTRKMKPKITMATAASDKTGLSTNKRDLNLWN